MRFGLNHYNKQYNLEEIGKKYNVTKEAIGQKMGSILNKLRTQKTYNKLRDYVSDSDIEESEEIRIRTKYNIKK